ncbi:MAG TPA: polysaccharide deacetylase family protein [Candidatus Bathyarchaeia archaeon]|nr:polysaccharide deacetylase family protein [Candidatus Bathyarchaeia archaeon]
MRKPDAVPVLMYHSVARPDDLAPQGWAQRLSTSPDLMEATLATWKRTGWSTIGLTELSAWLDGRGTIPPKSLVLTLDDGYVDNWTCLHPLLRAYGCKAVVFVSTDFIDPRSGCRPQDGQAREPGALKAYLSADEMRTMEADGSVEIGSHAKTHTWWFVSDRIVDWYRPEVRVSNRESLYRFLWLNAHPDRKPFVLADMDDETIPWGTPIYAFAPALVARRFVPDAAETGATIEHVRTHGGASFFQKEGWRAELDGLVHRCRSGEGGRGAWETEDERRRRVEGELAESRATLSAVLGRDVRMLSCPQGAMTEDVEAIAESVGYDRWTMSVWRHGKLNRPGASRRHIYRCGRGYELFPASWGRAAATRSHGIVLERYAGSTWARLATAGLSALGKALGSGSRDESPS